MNRESIIEGLRAQFAEQIHEMLVECEHRDHKKGKDWIDFHQLNEKLFKIMKNAQSQGLPHAEFIDLVKSELPHFFETLNFHTEQYGPFEKKAA